MLRPGREPHSHLPARGGLSWALISEAPPSLCIVPGGSYRSLSRGHSWEQSGGNRLSGLLPSLTRRPGPLRPPGPTPASTDTRCARQAAMSVPNIRGVCDTHGRQASAGPAWAGLGGPCHWDGTPRGGSFGAWGTRMSAVRTAVPILRTSPIGRAIRALIGAARPFVLRGVFPAAQGSRVAGERLSSL